MSSEYGRRITVNPILLTLLRMAFQFADQMPCGMRLLVSKPNQLTPVNRTVLPAESTIFDPDVDQKPSPGAAAAGCEAVSRIAAASRNGLAAHIGCRFMILSPGSSCVDRTALWTPRAGPGVRRCLRCEKLLCFEITVLVGREYAGTANTPEYVGSRIAEQRLR